MRIVPCLEAPGLSLSAVDPSETNFTAPGFLASGRKIYTDIWVSPICKSPRTTNLRYSLLISPSLHFTDMKLLLEAWSPMGDAEQTFHHREFIRTFLGGVFSRRRKCQCAGGAC